MKSLIKQLSLFFKLLRAGKIEEKDNLLIFIGDFGADILNKKYEKWYKLCFFIAINTDANHLQHHVKICRKDKLYIGDNIPNSCGKRDFESGINYVKTHKEIILRGIRKRPAKKNILVAALRNSSASGIIAELSAICKKNNIPAIALVSTPFKNEGESAEYNSVKALKVLEKNVNRLHIIACEDLQNKSPLFPQAVNNCFTENLEELIENKLG